MGDGITDGHYAAQDALRLARAEYGHMTKAEMLARCEELERKLPILKATVVAADTEWRAAYDESAALRRLLYEMALR